MLKIFSDPLYAGRFVSVLSGVAAVIGIYFLTRELFGRKAAIFSMLLYIFSPFAIVYDRLALMDSLLAMFGIWASFLQILLVKKQELDKALLLAIVIGLGLLTKSSALFYLYLLPVSLLFFNFKAKDKVKKFIKWILLSLSIFIIAEVMYNSLRLSPWFYIIKLKNYSFILTISEFTHNPWKLFIPNLNGLTQILIGYITIPIFITVIIGLVFGIIKKDKKIFYLFSWFIFPFISLGLFGKVIFPRFILFMIMPLYIISAYVLSGMFSFAQNKMKIMYLLVLLIFIYPVYQSCVVMFSPKDVQIPRNDRNQLFDDWPSGYGVKEVISYLDQKSKTGQIVVGTEGTFGLFPAGIEIYLGMNSNIKILGFWPVSQVPDVLLEAAIKYPTYLIFKESQNIPKEWPLTLVEEYRRGKGNTYLKFYRVDPAKFRT